MKAGSKAGIQIQTHGRRESFPESDDVGVRSRPDSTNQAAPASIRTNPTTPHARSDGNRRRVREEATRRFDMINDLKDG